MLTVLEMLIFFLLLFHMVYDVSLGAWKTTLLMNSNPIISNIDNRLSIYVKGRAEILSTWLTFDL